MEFCKIGPWSKATRLADDGADDPGVNVIIRKIFSRKKMAENIFAGKNGRKYFRGEKLAGNVFAENIFAEKYGEHSHLRTLPHWLSRHISAEIGSKMPQIMNITLKH
jgi:hypothetical protein